MFSCVLYNFFLLNSSGSYFKDVPTEKGSYHKKIVGNQIPFFTWLKNY